MEGEGAERAGRQAGGAALAAQVRRRGSILSTPPHKSTALFPRGRGRMRQNRGEFPLYSSARCQIFCQRVRCRLPVLAVQQPAACASLPVDVVLPALPGSHSSLRRQRAPGLKSFTRRGDVLLVNVMDVVWPKKTEKSKRLRGIVVSFRYLDSALDFGSERIFSILSYC